MSAWTVAVALGSDGTRSWFVIADSVTLRPPLSTPVRDRLMFLAGECSGVVLHRDLDAMAAADVDEVRRSRPRFAGWPILQDIEGRQPDEMESRCIAKRFVVARLPRLLVEDDLTIPLDRLRQQAQRAREEVGAEGGNAELGTEALRWEAVLEAFQEGDLEGLADRLLELGEDVERQNHLNGAAEIYRTAYDIHAATGQVRAAVDAARFSGRVLRRMARWDEAERWYGIAREIAETASMDDKVALAISGGAIALQERGSLPAARARLDEALPYAQRCGDPHVLGFTFHSLLALEHLRGNLSEALAWGWRAVTTYDEPNDRVEALASLSGALIDAKALDAAEDGWNCVLGLTVDDYYRLYATDALGHIAALRGDGAGFAQWASRADAMGWEVGPATAKAEILLYRGLSYQALGHPDRAREYLERALGFAEENGFNRILFAAEEALGGLREDNSSPPPVVISRATEEVRIGLHEMREELVGATTMVGGPPH
jgi:tetratricopeptide (TPR) repeat protein